MAALVREGFTSQVCLSQDHICALTAPRPSFYVPPEHREAAATRREQIAWQVWQRPYTYIVTDFVPRLHRAGRHRRRHRDDLRRQPAAAADRRLTGIPDARIRAGMPSCWVGVGGFVDAVVGGRCGDVVIEPGPELAPGRRQHAHWSVGRVAFLAISAICLYLFAPSIAEVFSAYDRLGQVHPIWLLPATLCAIGSFACVWLVQAVALGTRDWFSVVTTQLAGNAFNRITPGGGATGTALQANMLSDAGFGDRARGDRAGRAVGAEHRRDRRPCPCSRCRS